MLQLTGVSAFAAASALSVAGCKKEEPEPEPQPTTCTLKVYNPCGDVETQYTDAPRLDTLDGKTIAFVGNDMWEEQRTFEVIRKHLLADRPTATILGQENFPRHTDALTKANNGIAKTMKELGVDGVILGNAG